MSNVADGTWGPPQIASTDLIRTGNTLPRLFHLSLALSIAAASAGCTNQSKSPSTAQTDTKYFSAPVQDEFLGRIGKTYWIKSGSGIKFYATEKDALNKRNGYEAPIEKLFTIDDLFRINYSKAYRVKILENNQISFVEEFSLSYARNKEYLSEDKNELQELLKQSQSRIQELENRMRILGVSSGTRLWLRHPIEGMPGLTQITVKNIEAIKKSSEKLAIYLLVTSEHGEKKINLNADSTDDSSINYALNSKFYTEKTKKEFSGWGSKAINFINKGGIYLGMSDTQVVASLGRATKINQSVGRWGTHEQWVYGDVPYRSYLYFENGKLTSWQD